MGQEKKREIEVEAMCFAAGTAAFMACFERGILVLSFFEQWRMLMFLALNLLLLAILFTSTRTIEVVEDGTCADRLNPTADVEVVDKKNRKECADEIEDLKSLECSSESEKYPDSDEAEVQELSEQELNERAEAFIAMFRQHLASDGKRKSFGGRIHLAEPMRRGDRCCKTQRRLFN